MGERITQHAAFSIERELEFRTWRHHCKARPTPGEGGV